MAFDAFAVLPAGFKGALIWAVEDFATAALPASLVAEILAAEILAAEILAAETPVEEVLLEEVLLEEVLVEEVLVKKPLDEDGLDALVKEGLPPGALPAIEEAVDFVRAAAVALLAALGLPALTASRGVLADLADIPALFERAVFFSAGILGTPVSPRCGDGAKAGRKRRPGRTRL